MGKAREVMDRMTEALTTSKDLGVVAACFAEDAVAQFPDAGEVHGRDKIVEYWRDMTDAVPNSLYEPVHSYEVGDTAIDEGFWGGKNTGPIHLPAGGTLPATQKNIHIRGVDLATVKNGKIVNYRLYFDQAEFMTQLGLTPS